MELSERIKALRESKRIKLNEMATALGVDVSNYAKIEKKGKKLTLERIEEIASALGVTALELLEFESTEHSNSTQDLQARLKVLEKENFDLKAENKMYSKHNRILFDNVEVLQNIINSLMNNQQGLDKFKQIITGGNPIVEEQIKQAATSLFPDIAKQVELRKNKPENT
jgi:transcriptional regulator with XRE-family HTH domain